MNETREERATARFSSLSLSFGIQFFLSNRMMCFVKRFWYARTERLSLSLSLSIPPPQLYLSIGRFEQKKQRQQQQQRRESSCAFVRALFSSFLSFLL
jgi:hypothetical protein